MTLSPYGQTKVLLIEDTLSDAELVRNYLEEAQDSDNFQVMHAADMAEAMKMMGAGKVNAVMLDLLLPDTEGLSGLSAIRSLLPTVPVLILTGRDDEDLAFHAVESGAQDYLLKDKIDPKNLRRSIKYAIQRKKFEDRITFQANFDTLTSLPNRQAFRERLEVALARQHRTTNALCVMMLDLDGFKAVNDTYGHEDGDALLRVVGQRLLAVLRPYDMAARYGGDEFLVLIEDINKIMDVESVAQKIIQTVNQPVVKPETEQHVGVSVGIALCRPEENLSVDILLHRADQAMYFAKRTGTNGFKFYDEVLANEAQFQQTAMRKT